MSPVLLVVVQVLLLAVSNAIVMDTHRIATEKQENVRIVNTTLVGSIVRNVLLVSMVTQQQGLKRLVVLVHVLLRILLTDSVLRVIWVTMVYQFAINVLKDMKANAVKGVKNHILEIRKLLATLVNQ